MQYFSYPIAFIFLGPIWCWMLWTFCSLSYEMDNLLKSAKEDDQASIDLARRAWKAFTGNTFFFFIIFALIGYSSYLWVHSDYEADIFLLQFSCAAIYYLVTDLLETRFLEWQVAHSPDDTPSNT